MILQELIDKLNELKKYELAPIIINKKLYSFGYGCEHDELFIENIRYDQGKIIIEINQEE